MPGGSTIERDLRVRLAAMDWLSAFGGGHLFSRQDLAEFQFDGTRIALMDAGRGIRKPAGMDAALSVRTVYTPPNATPPYADEAGRDGFLRYKIRGDDRLHAENVGLRTAMRRSLPLIWFVGVSSGLYLARYPVYLVEEEAAQQQFVVALDPLQARTWHSGPQDEDERRYAETIARRRMHQPLFRARVLHAYEKRCAICRLRHESLLDASHIVSDRHSLGQPVVPNGLALCKIHHAAFDQNIIGISPDLVVDIRHDILLEVDGPMLRHGIQEMQGTRLSIPRQRASRPDRERLDLRYQEFRTAVP